MAQTPFIVDERIKRIIAGAVAEVDPAQIAIVRTWTPAQRVRQAVAMIEAGERAAAYRLRQRQPNLSTIESLRQVRLNAQKVEEKFQTWRRKR
ncbi:hypothetical protein KFU94_51465 [Chloroflexi bacterium TSY]|nr:hypothetical protein [Chloroflexi bacterium TSY]